MSMTIGRCAVTSNPYSVQSDGDMVALLFDIEPTVANDVNHMKALRQQLLGLANNADEPVVPVTWSEDPSFDGFYRVMGVSVPSESVMLTTGFIPGCVVQLERLTGFGSPWFEVTVQSVVRANVHSYTAPPSVVVVGVLGGAGIYEVDQRSITGGTTLSRVSADSASPLVLYTVPAPLALTRYRFVSLPSAFYHGACRVEIKYGSTWYQVVGRDVHRATVWRISNGLVRLTSADGATAGTIEIWNGSAWESISIAHSGGATPSVYGIGLGTGAAQPSITILRNAPERVTVKCSIGHLEATYSIQRGDLLVTMAWTGTSLQVGVNYSAVTTSSGLSGYGLRKTTNDANGNRVVFALPVAASVDLVNGVLYPTAAATSGQMMIAVELDGSGAAAGFTAADLVNQFMGATSWLQRVVPR